MIPRGSDAYCGNLACLARCGSCPIRRRRRRPLVDAWLAKYDVVWAAAGHPHAVFPTSFDELLRITGGAPAEVGD